jgi:hypothetical protein
VGFASPEDSLEVKRCCVPASKSGAGEEIRDAVHNHTKLRAWEDGEKPSPTRDCKAAFFFRAGHCLGNESRDSWRFGQDGKAALMLRIRGSHLRAAKERQAAKPGDRRSFNLDDVLAEGWRVFGQPSTPAREGEEEK